MLTFTTLTRSFSPWQVVCQLLGFGFCEIPLMATSVGQHFFVDLYQFVDLLMLVRQLR